MHIMYIFHLLLLIFINIPKETGTELVQSYLTREQALFLAPVF